jgi:hypothetical protein
VAGGRPPLGDTYNGSFSFLIFSFPFEITTDPSRPEREILRRRRRRRKAQVIGIRGPLKTVGRQFFGRQVGRRTVWVFTISLFIFPKLIIIFK